jgi:hypothetical protein
MIGGRHGLHNGPMVATRVQIVNALLRRMSLRTFN